MIANVLTDDYQHKQVGNRYAALIGDASAESSISRFFGLFFMIFQMSQIWGNMISSLGERHSADRTIRLPSRANAIISNHNNTEN